MSVYNDTMAILKKYKISADKSLGQNFLVSDEVVEGIVESANINKEDIIIEIGPGLGVLTNLLLEKSDDVIAVELDNRMVEIISDRFKEKTNLTVIHEDILKVDLKELLNNRKKSENSKVKVVANLPYYISTPIIMKLLEQNQIIDEIIVMVQKEVGQRLTAKTGTRVAGAITYAVEFYSDATAIINVPKESFVPSPKVESVVIKLKIKKQTQDINKEMLFKVIKTAFSQRRKTLSNALVNGGIVEKNKLEEVLEKAGLEKNVRGENLTLEDFIKLCENI